MIVVFHINFHFLFSRYKQVTEKFKKLIRDDHIVKDIFRIVQNVEHDLIRVIFFTHTIWNYMRPSDTLICTQDFPTCIIRHQM